LGPAAAVVCPTTEKSRPLEKQQEHQPNLPNKGCMDSSTLMEPFERDNGYASGKKKSPDTQFVTIPFCGLIFALPHRGTLSPVAPLFVSLPFSCLPLHFMQINLPEILLDFAASEA